MKVVKQSLLLLLSFAFIFAWQKTILSQYTIQIFGFLIFLFLISSARKRSTSAIDSFSNKASLSIFVLNTIIFLLIFSTGEFLSPLFFLLYFICFGIAFIFEPVTVFVFVIGTALIFLPDALENNVMENLIRIGSLFLISPLAFFFGKEYAREEKQDDNVEKLKERTKDSADTISEDVEEILESKKNNLGTKDVEKLNEILEETDDLREESKTS